MADQLVVNLLEEPIEEGEFRTKNKPGEKFRPVLVDRGNQLLTKVDIVGITHGELAESEDLATLLIFEFRFVATGGRRFKSASVVFRFEDSEGQMTRDPVVHAISPDGQWALNRTERVQNVKYGANAGINAEIGSVGAEAGVLWEVEEVKSREFYTALTGVKRIMRRGFVGEENVVIWTLQENEDKKDGIPTFMRAAVLLRRPYDVPFTFSVKVKADVDFIGEVKTLFGLERKDPIDPVEIDPEKFPKAGRATVKTLDPKIHDLKEMDNLDLQEVAGVTVVTVLDGGGLHKGRASK
ncbi:hypothetical protein DL770_001281 [Monosporascus sp. CRB-9-2]|nr:hypothetical protein DL770_001281 [Monosporascus sp. CRB-9-2]